MQQTTEDLRIQGIRPLVSPDLLHEELPLSTNGRELINETRQQAEAIIKGDDDRLLVVVGPCSIHDTKAALDYAEKLASARQTFAKDLLVVMRIYFEKPRTTVGWKGLINDPELNGSFRINHGLRTARQLLLDLAHAGMPTACEFLDTIVPQYIADLVSWGAIGARTTESQIHRELASGMSMPMGFKNGTDGNVQIAIDAVRAAKDPHHFLSVTKQSLAAIVSTAGNSACHVILRGSTNGPNFETEFVKETLFKLNNAGLHNKIMIDLSHGNSSKDHTRQPLVAADVCRQLVQGEQGICGVMIESNLVEGKQSNTPDKELIYGQSITDACLSWEQTLPVLEQLAQSVQQRRQGD
ncbi:MAG: 3-deoxy-7-phosphoheptulonate synthase [Legionellales bacterium]|nr:3-deoxy-7-phosphoheptulonate synthase [Legionellales bacterium]